MTKQITIELTKAEVEHILQSIEMDNAMASEFTSELTPDKQYWKRSERLKLKLAQAKTKKE